MRGERWCSLRSPATLPGHLSASVCSLSGSILGQDGQVVSSDTEATAGEEEEEEEGVDVHVVLKKEFRQK